jgi:hypothetical protein
MHERFNFSATSNKEMSYKYWLPLEVVTDIKVTKAQEKLQSADK